jgi:hypothetical protein
MKTRLLIFIGVSAIATLSFTFASVSTKQEAKQEPATSAKAHDSEPAGGFLSEDKL